MQNVKITRKGKGAPVPPRLFIIFAREAPSAMIFRRGPSYWTQLIRWNTLTDNFEAGQWFRGRLYERRSDLSPDGSLLIYFARKMNGRTLKDKEYTYAWTAISKPPFLTALALWPKGNCWHGGGLFRTDRKVELNHPPEAQNYHPNHQPQGLRVVLRKNVFGEDDPIYSERLERDGWRLKQKWQVENRGYPLMFKTLKSELREKHGFGDLSIQLARSIRGLDYSEDFRLIDRKNQTTSQIDRANWVDWDQHGRLIIARDGKIFTHIISEGGMSTDVELINLTENKPMAVPSPEWAKTWERA